MAKAASSGDPAHDLRPSLVRRAGLAIRGGQEPSRVRDVAEGLRPRVRLGLIAFLARLRLQRVWRLERVEIDVRAVRVVGDAAALFLGRDHLLLDKQRPGLGVGRPDLGRLKLGHLEELDEVERDVAVDVYEQFDGVVKLFRECLERDLRPDPIPDAIWNLPD